MWNKNTLSNTLKPLWFLNTLCCLRINNVKKYNRWFEIFSVIYRLYYCFIFIVSVTILILFLSSTPIYNKEIKQSERFHTIINQFLYLFEIIQGITFHVNMKNVVETINETDFMLTQLGIQVSYSSVKLYLLIRLLLIFGLLFSYFVYFTYTICENSIQWCIVTWLIYYNNRFITYLTIVEFCVFVYLLQIRFIKINNHLKNLNLERYIRTFQMNNAVIKDGIFSTIRNIKLIQNKLYQSKLRVNNIYASTLFLSFFVCFTEIYFLLHYFIIEVVNQHTSTSFCDAIFHILFTIYTFYKLLHVVTMCEKMKRVHLETGGLLYNVSIGTEEFTLLRLVRIMFNICTVHTYF